MGQDSEIDENIEISEMERRDFDDIEGIEVDLDWTYYHNISFRQYHEDPCRYLNYLKKSDIGRAKTLATKKAPNPRFSRRKLRNVISLPEKLGLQYMNVVIYSLIDVEYISTFLQE